MAPVASPGLPRARLRRPLQMPVLRRQTTTTALASSTTSSSSYFRHPIPTNLTPPPPLLPLSRSSRTGLKPRSCSCLSALVRAKLHSPALVPRRRQAASARSRQWQAKRENRPWSKSNWRKRNSPTLGGSGSRRKQISRTPTSWGTMQGSKWTYCCSRWLVMLAGSSSNRSPIQRSPRSHLHRLAVCHRSWPESSETTLMSVTTYQSSGARSPNTLFTTSTLGDVFMPKINVWGCILKSFCHSFMVHFLSYLQVRMSSTERAVILLLSPSSSILALDFSFCDWRAFQCHIRIRNFCAERVLRREKILIIRVWLFNKELFLRRIFFYN